MATNPYMNHYYAQNEQNLIDKMVIEAIQHQGLDIAYLPRTQNDIDPFYKEDPTNTFDESVKIEMYPSFVDGFSGDGDMFSRFGLDIKETGTFVVSKTRFAQEFPDLKKPREGDLLIMPLSNSVLEIKFVEDESPFFQKGKQYVWELKAETFEYGYEDIQTNDYELDELLDKGMLIDDLLDPSKAAGDNEEIQDAVEDSISFDPSNPFSVR